MGGNPYAAPASPGSVADDAEVAQRIAGARRLGRRALMMFVGGLAVGGICVGLLGGWTDDATPIRRPAGTTVALLLIALCAQVSILAGMVIGMLAVVRGALRRRRTPVASDSAPPA